MRAIQPLSAAGLLTAALLALPAGASGQAALGVSVGATFSTFEGDDVSNLDSNTGFMAGAHLAFPVGEIVSVVPGAYYVQKGAARGDDSQTISYLEIPVLLSVSVLPPERPMGLNLFAGPEVAFKVGCTFEEDGVSGDCPDDDDIAGTDFGLLVGAGLDFGRFFVNGGLDLGLKSIDDSTEDNDVKNSTWFLSGGINVPLGG